MLPPGLRPPASAVTGGNAAGFVLLELWFIAVTERVLRRSRPDEPHGRYAPWRHPRRPGLLGALLGALLGRCLDWPANSRFARYCLERLPPLALASDIMDVIYVNYLVPADRLLPLVPPGLCLQRLGPDGRYAVYTFLTYRHGHFGPALAGPCAACCPPPSNPTGASTSPTPAPANRASPFSPRPSPAPPTLWPPACCPKASPCTACRAAKSAPTPTAPSTSCWTPPRAVSAAPPPMPRPRSAPPLPPPWDVCFASYRDMLAYIVPQDRAMSCQPWRSRVTRQEIELGILPEACEPLEGGVKSRAAEAVAGGDAKPLCFRVARLAFRSEREEYDEAAFAATTALRK